MKFVEGVVKKVEADKSVMGAFGREACLVVYVARGENPDIEKDYADLVKVADCPENRAIRSGMTVKLPVSDRAKVFEGKPYIESVSKYVHGSK